MRVIDPVEILFDDVLACGMANKKRKQHAANNSASSRKKSNNNSPAIEDDDVAAETSESTTLAKCVHLKAAFNAAQVRKKMKNLHSFHCEDCSKAPEKTADEERNEEDSGDVCCCLLCGHLGCSRASKNEHAINHFEKPRSGLHYVVLNLRTFELWCYKCDDAVSQDASPQLREIVDWIGRHMKSKSNDSRNVQTTVANKKTESVEATKPTAVTRRGTGTDSSSEIKGLSNLGNTCFFNAVMQSIAQTHELQYVLNDADTFLKGGKIVVHPLSHNKETSSLDPVEVKIDTEPGLLASELSHFLTNFRQNKSSVLNPAGLFGIVCKKAPRFRGYQQQDSHELLRYMLDALRMEETKRLRAAVTCYFGIDPTDTAKIANLDPTLKSKIKAYDAIQHTTFVEEVFGGQLLQVIKCLQCQHSSQRYEQFLDLSLPIVDAKVAREATIIKTDDNLDSKPEKKGAGNKLSKHQQKKVSKNTRKLAKAAAKRRSSSTIENENGESITSNNHEAEAESNNATETSKETDLTELGDALNYTLTIDNDGLNETACEENGTTVDTAGSLHSDPPAANGTMDAKLDSDSDEDEDEDEDEDKDDNKHVHHNEDDTCSNVEPLGTEDASSYSTKCTLSACLRNFTTVELLTGKNKFGCANCAKASNDGRMHSSSNCATGQTDDVKKSRKDSNPVVYTDAEKRYLIYSPPAVLTFHLKRFQQAGVGMRKINKHVEFPTLLDISPYCCKNGKRYNSVQKRVLYSLYGIVSHSGGLSGGHYVAYVKIRAKKEKLTSFLQRFTTSAGSSNSNGIENSAVNGHASEGSDHTENGPLKSDAFEPSPRQGKWYHVSDTHVSEVPESRVLASEAYLLFYERIY